MTRLETERLWLEPLTLADAPAIQAVFPVWEVVRWLANVVPWPYPDDGAETFVSQVALPAMAAGTAWHWSIRRKAEPDRLIGVVSLTDRPEDNRGFWIDPAWQGRGFATEASAAATDYWFDVLGKPMLRVPKAVANPASRRISEKQGMRVARRLELPLVSGVEAAELWEIDAETWREIRPPGLN
jgi:RimJ/RimL family protein N-acetyltransferase